MADLLLSTNKAYANSSLIKIRQDDYGQTITAIITDKMNSPLDLSKAQLSFKVKNWDGETITDTAVTADSNGNVTYTINKKTPLVTGQAWFEIKDGDNKSSTQTFWLQVMEAGEQVIELADPLGGVTTIN